METVTAVCSDVGFVLTSSYFESLHETVSVRIWVSLNRVTVREGLHYGYGFPINIGYVGR